MNIIPKLEPGRLPRMRSGDLAPNTLPGMYPVMFYCADSMTGDLLHDPVCADCANGARERGEVAVEWFTPWEGPPLYCADCGEPVETAYGDPWEDGGAH